MPLVEAGKLEGPAAQAAVDGYLDQLLAADPQIDTLLLGCTHYPLLRPLIERRAGPGWPWSTPPSPPRWPRRTCSTRSGRAPARTAGETEDRHRIATTGDVAAFSAVAERVFGARLPRWRRLP